MTRKMTLTPNTTPTPKKMTPERIALLKSFEPKVRPPATKSTEVAKNSKDTKDTK